MWGSSANSYSNRVHPRRWKQLASAEEIRAWAQQKAEGKTLDSFQQAAVDRTTSQAGSEGRAVTRILGGGKA